MSINLPHRRALLGGAAPFSISDLFANGTYAGFDFTDLDVTKQYGPDNVGLAYQSQAITPVASSTDPVGVLLNKERQLEAPTNWTAHNLAVQAQTLDNGAWSVTNATISANVIAAPDGTLTADKVVESVSASVSHVVSQSFGISISGATYTFAIRVKAAERSWVRLLEIGVSGVVGAYFNVGTGAIGTITGSASPTITPIGNGWYLCTITYVATSAGTPNHLVRLATGDGGDPYVGDGTSGAYAWGAQVNRGTVPTTYIATTTLGGFQQINAALQATSGQRPTWQANSGKPYLNFDGVDDNLATLLVPATAGMTLAACLRPASTASLMRAISAQGSGRCGLSVDGSGLPAGQWGTVLETTIKGGASITGTDAVTLLRANASVVELWCNGTLVYSGASSGAPDTSFGLWIGAGNNSGSSSQVYTGRIYRAAAVQRFIPDSMVLPLMRALGAGIVSF